PLDVAHPLDPLLATVGADDVERHPRPGRHPISPLLRIPLIDERLVAVSHAVAEVDRLPLASHEPVQQPPWDSVARGITFRFPPVRPEDDRPVTKSADAAVEPDLEGVVESDVCSVAEPEIDDADPQPARRREPARVQAHGEALQQPDRSLA